MAKRRQKSYNDIINQRDRILGRMGLGAEANAPSAASQGYRYSYMRANRVIDTASKYMRNIRSMKSQQNNMREGAFGIKELNNKGRNRSVARNTYMGLNEG